MQTRLYDSAEPGPPHGWLDMGAPPQAPEMKAWDEVIPWILRGDPPDKAGANAASSLQFWGGLRWQDRWWIYRLLPAGLDRHGRPGRTLTALFCAKDKQGFEWQAIGSIADELEALAKDPRHLSAVQRVLHQARTEKSLTDDLLKKPQRSLSEPLRSALLSIVSGLQEGEHERFTANTEGLISNRTRDTFAPPPSHPPATQTPSAKPAPAGAASTGIPSTFMKKGISHFMCVILGMALGYFLQPHFSAPKPYATKSEPRFTSDDDAMMWLEGAVKHIKRSLKSNQPSAGPSANSKQPEGYLPAQETPDPKSFK